MAKRVLLADDSVTIRKVVGIIFADDEYELTVVDNGDAALEKARETLPDVMLVDALMPGKSGFDVCQEIRSDPRLKATPILLLVGAFESYDENRVRDCGADETISKPFESQQLVDRVTELLALGEKRRAELPPPEPENIPAAVETEEAPFEELQLEEMIDLEDEVVEATLEDDLWGAFQAEKPAPVPPQSSAVEPEPLAFGFATDFAETVPGATGLFETEAAPSLEDAFTFDAPLEPSGPSELDTFFFGAEEAASEASVAEFAPEPVTVAVDADVDLGVTASPIMGVSESELPVSPKTAPAVSEEQLFAAIRAISQEVIERIVWEVVPDLAETLIKEEIKKLKAGTPR